MDIFNMTIDEVAIAVEYKVNTMSSNNMKTLVSKLSTMHRTLVQSFVGKFIVPYVRTMAKKYKDGCYDKRNKSACELCNTMWNAIRSKYEGVGDDDTYLPFI